MPDCEAELNILQKYFLREWFWAFLAMLVVLVIVMLGFTFGELVNDVADGRVPPGLLGSMLLLKLPDMLATIVPLAVFIAVLWGLGRMYRDHEMVVMRASGVGWQLMLRPLFNLLLPVAAVILSIGLFLAPAAAGMAQAKLQQAYRTAQEWGLQTGRFHVLQDGDLVLYVESVEGDGRTLQNIFIQRRQDGREQVWTAEKGYYWFNPATAERFLTLENGQITEGGAQTLDFGIVRFSRNDLLLPEPEQKAKPPALEARRSRDLLFTGKPDEAAELQWRLAPGMAVVVLGLLGVPLSHSGPREGRATRVLMGMLAYATYVNGLYISRSWTAEGLLPPQLGLLWVHGVVLAVAIVWVRRQHSRVGSR